MGVLIDIRKPKRCECPLEGRVLKRNEDLYTEEELVIANHPAGECQGTDLALYRRGIMYYYLCSLCSTPADALQ